MADGRSQAKENSRTQDQAKKNKRIVTGPNRPAMQAGDHYNVRVVEEKPDYYICFYLGVFNTRPVILTEATDPDDRDIIEVAKGIEFRRSHLQGLSQPNRNGDLLSYEYTDANGTERTVTKVDSDPVVTEDQVIVPKLLEEQTIDDDVYAGSYLTMEIVRNGTGVKNDAGDDLYNECVNIAGRQWAVKDTTVESEE